MIIDQAKEVLRIEAEGVLSLVDRLDNRFAEMVELIFGSTGRLIVSGIGKSGIVGQKIVATLNSTGTRALFLHPVEAMHGDLGVVGKDDILLALSNSGETEELNILVPVIRHIGCKIIAFTGRMDSSLAKMSDIVIDVGVTREACPLGLAPTASTTAVLAMGDALAVVLINKKKFKQSDFKKIHPGGALGQRLSLQVSDIMLHGTDLPIVPEASTIMETLKVMNRFELGVALIIDNRLSLTGIITDGDIRRIVMEKESFQQYRVDELMTKNPQTIHRESPVYDALNLMEHYQITVLPVINPAGQVEGMLHLHDILGKGAFKFNGAPE
ncbi:MAG: KpsF/GutQ family sugar-phosphate isomerase [Desulfobacteraceae bacterium]|nr:MAG: KpsF/GutQ family sugar-phosphate isomerase [Desulfobacteraceae bacterium]